MSSLPDAGIIGQSRRMSGKGKAPNAPMKFWLWARRQADVLCPLGEACRALAPSGMLRFSLRRLFSRILGGDAKGRPCRTTLSELIFINGAAIGKWRQ